MAFEWHVMVDWDGDGTPETDERGRLVKLRCERGRRQQFARSANFQRPIVGNALLTLDNYDGRYTPTNTASPLYPDIFARREVVVTVEEGATEYNVFRGFVDALTINGRGDAELRCQDGWRWLQDIEVELPATTDIRTGEAIEEIVLYAGYPNINWRLGTVGQSELGETTRLATPGGQNWSWGYDIAPGRTIIPYWWATGSAKAQIEDLAATEGGFAYVAADGQFVFMDRDTIYAATPAVTVTQDLILNDVQIGHPADTIYNIVQVTARPLEQVAVDQIWRYQFTPTTLGPGQSLTVEADHRTAINIVTPVKTTDYTLNMEPDGSGTDVTASSTSSLDWEGGSRSQITLTNTGSWTAYLTFFQLRGEELDALDTVTARTQDNASIAQFGPKALAIDTDWIQTFDEAAAYADWLASWLFDQRSVPALQFEHRGSYQFGYDLGDLFTLDVDYFELEETFLLGYIRHEWSHPAGQQVTTTWYGERVDNQDYWRLGVAGQSELGETTYLGY